MYERDTIAAISTPPGRGGIGVVRISGPAAPAIAGRVFSSKVPLHRWRSHQLYRGYLLAADGKLLDDGLGVWMREPNSYTGEHVVEIHAHGSPVVLRHFLAHVFTRGARPAEPGEFTRRAFLNGRLDLAQAEAVADLIHARTLRAAESAAAQASGALSRTIRELRERILNIRCLVEAQIDFGDEIDLGPEPIRTEVEALQLQLQRLLQTYRHGMLLREGARVALVGKPNVGKSSLLNALLGAERAIVTDLPGTTRDTLEETIDCEGIPVNLLDTAGLRSESSADPVERLGMERSQRAIEQADLLLLVVDRSRPPEKEDFWIAELVQHRPHMIVFNKCDLAPSPEWPHSFPETWPQARCALEISALTGTGLAQLRRQIATFLSEATETDASAEPVIGHARHYAALQQASEALQVASELLSNGLPLDIAAAELMQASDALGSIVGEITSEDVLDQIFARFCLGK